MFGNWHTALAAGGPRVLSGLFPARVLSSGSFSGFRRRLRVGVQRVGSNWWPILQTAAAASAAWYLASLVFGHEQPFVAAIAAVISLGATVGRTGRRAVEWILGVALGLTVADLLVLAIGTGSVQIGVVVALALAVALFLGGGAGFVTEAGVSALLVVTLDPSTAGPTPDRFLDALVGCGVALAINSLFPVNPKLMVEQAARPVFEDLRAALAETSGALADGDRARAEGALRRAREIDARVAGLKEALGTGYETARLSPSRRGTLRHLALYAAAADQIDLAVRNTRVLARAAVGLVRSGEPAPGLLSEAVLDLARAVGDLAGRLEEAGRESELLGNAANPFALKAAEEATVALNQRSDLATNVLVGQVRSTAEDLLRASGMGPDEASGALDGAVRTVSGGLDHTGAQRDTPA